MKVFITTYALTQGIKEMDVELCDSQLTVVKTKYQFFHKPNWHTLEREAKKIAEEMRINKIKSMEKQLRKLHRLKFDQ